MENKNNGGSPFWTVSVRYVMFFSYLRAPLDELPLLELEDELLLVLELLLDEEVPLLRLLELDELLALDELEELLPERLLLELPLLGRAEVPLLLLLELLVRPTLLLPLLGRLLPLLLPEPTPLLGRLVLPELTLLLPLFGRVVAPLLLPLLGRLVLPELTLLLPLLGRVVAPLLPEPLRLFWLLVPAPLLLMLPAVPLLCGRTVAWLLWSIGVALPWSS